MSSSPSSATPATSATPVAPSLDDAFFQQALHDLVSMGMDIARTIHAQAQANPATPGEPAPDLTIPFDRIARTVRRTVRLAQHLAQQKPASNRIQARKQILRTVEDTIHRHQGPGATALHTELLDRLDAPDLVEDFDHDLATRPLSEIVTELTRDLGLAGFPGMPPIKRRTPDDIRHLAQRARGLAPRPEPASPLHQPSDDPACHPT